MCGAMMTHEGKRGQAPRRRALGRARAVDQPSVWACQRGSVLLVAMLLFMAAIAMGAVAIFGARSDLSNIGSQEVSKQLENLSEGGLMAMVALAAQDPEAFVVNLRNRDLAMMFSGHHTGTGNYELDISMVTGAFVDQSPGGSFGYKSVVADKLSVMTMLDNRVSVNRVPGFSVGEFCFQKYRWRTTAGFMRDLVPGATEDNTTTQSLYFGGEKTFSTYAYVGPVTCRF